MLNQTTVTTAWKDGSEKQKGRLRRSRRAAARELSHRQGLAAPRTDPGVVATTRFGMPSLDARQQSGFSARYPALNYEEALARAKSNPAMLKLATRLTARLWETQDATVLPISEMGVSHLRATIRMLRHQRNATSQAARAVQDSVDPVAYFKLMWEMSWRCAYLILMEQEMIRREPGYSSELKRHGESLIKPTTPEGSILTQLFPDLRF